MKPRVAITLGDPAGIGPEIVSQALRDRHVQAACLPLVIPQPKKAVRVGRPSKMAGQIAIDSLRHALDLLRTRRVDALVTAPVSKESFAAADLGFPGHTEWLAQETHSPVAMLMVAGPLRAILMTRHVPLGQVSKHLTKKEVLLSIRLGQEFVQRTLHLRNPRLVLCGVNPHAGDGGLIGREEKNIFLPTLRSLPKSMRTHVKGPIPADSAFRDMAAGHYDLALAAYHDQGMIPLKLFAPDRLVNITLGLPFVRTSPGHGTAYDIAGQKKADPRPMIEAILLAATYSRHPAGTPS